MKVIILYFNNLVRIKCNRCGKSKLEKTNSNKFNTTSTTNDNNSRRNSDENKVESSNILTANTSINNQYENDHQNSNSNNDSTKKKKPFVERAGDWVCIKCKNLNFSFRVVCNRCQLPKKESQKIYDNYMKNLMSYVKINEIMQKGVNNEQKLNPYFNNYQSFIPNNNNFLDIENEKCNTEDLKPNSK
jgi:hypothetical protein